jgi:hypothetical protein
MLTSSELLWTRWWTLQEQANAIFLLLNNLQLFIYPVGTVWVTSDRPRALEAIWIYLKMLNWLSDYTLSEITRSSNTKSGNVCMMQHHRTKFSSTACCRSGAERIIRLRGIRLVLRRSLGLRSSEMLRALGWITNACDVHIAVCTLTAVRCWVLSWATQIQPTNLHPSFRSTLLNSL